LMWQAEAFHERCVDHDATCMAQVDRCFRCALYGPSFGI